MYSIVKDAKESSDVSSSSLSKIKKYSVQKCRLGLFLKNHSKFQVTVLN